MGGIVLWSALAAIGVLLATTAIALPSSHANVTDPGSGWQPASLRERVNQPFQALADRSNRQRRLNGGLTLAEHLVRADLKLRTSEFVMIRVAFLIAGAVLAPWRFRFAP